MKMKMKMKSTASMIIQKSDSYRSRQIRTLVLSNNVNDYDTGEPIVDGSIIKTLTKSNSHIVDNPILLELNGIKVGRKYHTSTTISRNTLAPDVCSKSSNWQQSLPLLL